MRLMVMKKMGMNKKINDCDFVISSTPNILTTIESDK